VRRFELAVPTSVDECLKVLTERGPDTRVVAGGTDLLPQMKNGVLKPGWVVDLSGIAELRAISDAPGGGLRIGAAVSARDLELDSRVQSRFPSLAESASMVGSVQVRNLATLGGNLCNAAPSADMAPPLLALDADAVIAGPKGRRQVPMASFFLGVRKTVLEPGELLLELVVPPQAAGSGDNYLRHTPRRELDIAVVGVASAITLAGGKCSKARIALAAVAPVPLRATEAEKALTGQPVTPDSIERAAGLAADAARPIDDHRGSIQFRRHLVRVLTRRTLTTALERASR
jgi:CO/xanthine dehydrogenase FAD-binding subunit